jgi:tetratricopeptide (TPR) repeat protein
MPPLLECASVRLSVIFLLAGSLAASITASADVIRLKNGRTIWADHVRDTGKRLEYDIGDNSYAIPKSLVDRVDTGGIPPQLSSASGSAAHDVPDFAPAVSLRREADVASKIVHDNQVDVEALAAVEKEGNAELTATAYFLAGKHEFDRNNLAGARRYFETALRFQGENATILTYYSALLARTGNAAEALPFAQRAVASAPDSPDALTILGYVQASTDHTQDAIRTFKRSLKVRPDPAVEKFLAQAQREATVEADYSSRESSHFILRFEGRRSDESFRRDLLATLEAHYDDLVRELGVTPRSSIPVALYTEQAFFDVTQAPSWSGAVNDGKLRIPINGLVSVTPELSQVLKHELAHSFINQISGGRCPQWLHEGIAQLVEGKSTQSSGRQLSQLFQADHALPFNTLEGNFMGFSAIEARLAYDQSLAAVEFIHSTSGMGDLQRILERIGQGSSTEAALRSTIHSDYRQLQDEVARYLKDRYGN